MVLKCLSKEDVEIVRQWRNEAISTYRTPFYLTEEMQQDFYKDVICNRNSPHRYYGFHTTAKFIAMGGITNIQAENRIGEISLIVNPSCRRTGAGRHVVTWLLRTAFAELNLKTVFGEVYNCGPVDFWKKMNPDYTTILPNRKYANNEYHNSMYFSWSKP